MTKSDVQKLGDASLLSLARLEQLVVLLRQKLLPSLWTRFPTKRRRANEEDPFEEAFTTAKNAWITVYLAFSARKKNPERIEAPPAADFISQYAGYALDLTISTRLKFHTAYLFAKHTGNVVPVRPNCLLETELSGVLAGNWIWRHSRNLMTRPIRYSTICSAADILFSKYGMPAVSTDMVDDALTVQRQKLSTPFTEPSSVFNITKAGEAFGKPLSLTENRVELDIQASITKVVEACFRNTEFSSEGVYLPKVSASFSKKTSQGGQLLDVVDNFLATLSQEELGEIIRVFSIGRTEVNRILELDGETKIFSTHKTDICEQLMQFSIATCAKRIFDPLKARQFGIPEPLKVRTILIAMAEEMFVVTKLQKAMHSVLRRIPIFRYIGQPDDLEEITKTFTPKENDELTFTSADFSDATNGLRSSLSEYAWAEIARVWDLNDFWSRLGRKCLTQHKIVAKAGRGPIQYHETNCYLQANGQSMGSPMSFPILCIVNAACFMLAYGWETSQLWKGAVRINGDDIVFRARADLYQNWWKINSYAGLYPSVGKNYVSNRFLTINSHIYWWSQKRACFRQAHCVNTAILRNLVRKGPTAGSDTGASWFEKTTNFASLIEGHSPQLQSRLSTWYNTFNPLPKGMPADLPMEIGGPGRLLPGEHSLKARRMAACIMSRKEDRTRFQKKPRSTPDNIVEDALKEVREYWTYREEILRPKWGTWGTYRDPQVTVRTEGGELSGKEILEQVIVRRAKLFFAGHRTAERIFTKSDYTREGIDYQARPVKTSVKGGKILGSVRFQQSASRSLRNDMDDDHTHGGTKSRQGIIAAERYTRKVLTYYAREMDRLFPKGEQGRVTPCDSSTLDRIATGFEKVVVTVSRKADGEAQMILDHFACLPFALA